MYLSCILDALLIHTKKKKFRGKSYEFDAIKITVKYFLDTP